MSLRLSGINPLAYSGVEATQPPLLVREFRQPTSKDIHYNIGTFWLIDSLLELWILASLVNGIAIWIQLAPGGTAASTYIANIGSASPLAGVLNMFGSTSISTSGAGNTVSINTTGDIAITYACDVGSATPNVGLLAVVGTNVLSTTGSGNTITCDLLNGANGQTLIGGNAQPLWRNITSTGGTIAITNGPNSINLEATGTGGAQTFDADSGSAAFVLDQLNIVGGSNINTSASGNTVTTNLDNSVSISGSVTANTTITVGTGLTVTSGGITDNGPVRLTDLTAGVMQTNGAGSVSSTNGTAGEVIIGGGAAPAWANITSTGGTVTIANGPNSIDLSVSGFVPPASRAAFLAYCPSNFFGACADSNTYLVAGAAPFPGFTKVFDQTNSLNPGDGAGTPLSFTCPLTGKYYLEFYYGVNITVPLGSSDRAIADIRSSSGIIYRNMIFVVAARSPRTVGHAVIAALTAGEVITFQVSVVGTNTYLGNATDAVTWVCGYLIA